MTRSFGISFDYRCPFARCLHHGVLEGLREGRDWDVTFIPFSQDQSQLADDDLPVWEQDPATWGTGVLPLCWGLAVRVVTDNALRDTYLSKGSFGWSGASGTHFWVDPDAHIVAVFMGSALVATGQSIEIIAITLAIYLTLSLAVSLFMNWYNARHRLVTR